MNKITKEQIKEIAHNHYFDIDDQLLNVIYSDYLKFINELSVYDNFNLNDVLPTDYCVEQSCSSLREDTPVIQKNPEEFIKNAKNKFGKYIVVK